MCERRSSSRDATSSPSSRYSPALGRSRQPRMPSRVDLPEPEGPMIATFSPARDPERHAVEGHHVAAAARVDLPHPREIDERRA